MIQLIYDGLSIKDDSIVYDSAVDSDTDIMNTVTPDIYMSEFGGNVYYFGYRFKDTASRKDRTTIIHWLKGINGNSINKDALHRFIDKPIKYLNKSVDLSEFSCMVYPKSGRSDLTKEIITELNNFAQRDTVKTCAEFFKEIPKNIEFDWELFDSEYEGDIGDNQYNQIKNYVNNDLIPKIHSLEYFSIANSVKTKYRRYIKNYLTIDNRSEQVIHSIKNGKVLIVDDINTSGSTLNEIIRKIRKINNSCEIFIFTLIGK